MHWSVASWIGWGIAVLVILPHVQRWRRTNELFGGIDLPLVRRTLHLCRFTGQWRILLLSPLSPIMLVVMRSLEWPIPSGIFAVVIAVSLVPLLALALPPAVLFLAASGERANTIYFQLHMLAGPLRVVALLDPGRMGMMGRMMRLDLMRTTNDATWKSMVHQLIEIAPVYVVDTVHRTGPVRYEAFLMLAPERAGRTVFICGEDGKCPSLLEERIDPAKHAIPVTRLEGLAVALDRLLHVSRSLPKSRTPNPGESAGVVPENWESLPSVLAIVLAEGLDGSFVLDQASATDKTLIELMLPLATLDGDAAEASVELTWEFSRDPKLVGLYLERTGLVMVRRDFLLHHADLLRVQVAALSPGKMTFEDLNRPEPVHAAVHELCNQWRRRAGPQGLEFRFADK